MDRDQPAIGRDYLAQLERAFIEQFLRERGYGLDDLAGLPPATAKALLAQASVYASGRLTEVESRAHFVSDLHDAGHPEPHGRHGS